MGTKNALDLALKCNASIILLSSVEIYGEIDNEVPINESQLGHIDLTNYRSCYPESKRASEILAQCYLRDNLNVKIARLCRVFGPTMLNNDNKASAQFLKNGKIGVPIILKSHGSQKFSYIYSCDAVRAILYILLYGKVGVPYNVSSTSCNCMLREFAEMVKEESNSELKFELGNVVGSSNSQYAILDSGNLESIGWQPKFSLRNGISRTLKIML